MRVGRPGERVRALKTFDYPGSGLVVPEKALGTIQEARPHGEKNWIARVAWDLYPSDGSHEFDWADGDIDFELIENRIELVPGFENAKHITVAPGQAIDLDCDVIIDGDVPSDATINMHGYRIYVTGQIFSRSIEPGMPPGFESPELPETLELLPPLYQKECSGMPRHELERRYVEAIAKLNEPAPGLRVRLDFILREWLQGSHDDRCVAHDGSLKCCLDSEHPLYQELLNFLTARLAGNIHGP